MNHYEILRQIWSIIVDKILLFMGIPAKIALWECCEQALFGKKDSEVCNSYWDVLLSIVVHGCKWNIFY